MRLAKLTANLGLATMTAVACLATAVACSGGSAPALDGLSDQVAQVGTEFTLDLDGTDPDGDRLTYGFHAADIADIDDRAMITLSPSGIGVFRWTPIAEDVGLHSFDFTVSDGDHTSTETITIEVKSAIGSATAPIFRQPLGTGTTIDLSQHDCLDLDVVVEDQDTAQVTLTQEEPVIDGAELTQQDGQSAKWHWCPTRAQQGDTRYTLVLGADDGDNPKTIKNYLVVLRGNSDGNSCPGQAPSISHTAANETTRLDLTPDVSISDDQGLKDNPLLYYSTTNPGSMPDLSTMTQLTMTLASGTAMSGTWTASIPNPVANAIDGTQQTLYYVIAADDDDDQMGNCDHSTVSQVYSMTVTAGGTTTAGLCSACSADSQCGDGNECVYMGASGDTYCLQACDAGCPSGYACSASPIYSVDGAMEYQCVPQSGSCQMPAGACEDDQYEENDSRSAASANPAISADVYDMVACPSTTSSGRTDDDWYKLVVAADSRVDLEVIGDGASDLDLHLYRSDQTVIAASTTYESDEQLSQCLAAGTYYIKVNGYGGARSEYLLSYDSSAEACDTTCVDDGNEDDDTFSTARGADYPTDTETDQTICPNDDDWYQVSLF
jgi:hypothetical protein